MVDVITNIVIACPVVQVAAYAADPDNAPKWYVNIDSVDWQTPRPLAVGTRLAFQARFLGRQLAYVYEVITLELPQKLVMRTADGPFPMETTYTWEKIDEQHTRMQLRNRGEPSGFSRLFSFLMAPAMRRANLKDLLLLKQLLEKKAVI